MGIEITLRDIANESKLNKAEKTSLRLIAKEVEGIIAENARLKEENSRMIKFSTDILGEITLQEFDRIVKNTIDYTSLRAENDKLEEALRKIDNWVQAYPLEVFPKPDLKKAAVVLKASGMTLDSILYDAKRHVLEGIKDIVGQALKGD